MTTPTAAVVGQLARDLVLSVDDLPEPGSSADAIERREQLGGKGANQAVGLAQLGVRPTLVAVAGDDAIGDVLLDQARRDRIDVAAVVRRDVHVPLTDDEVVDTTGGGDAFVAALTASLLRGEPYPEAARRATAASGATAGHAGGRPDLSGTAARG